MTAYWELPFGAPVTFDRHYQRFVGRETHWPRGAAARYGRPGCDSVVTGTPHPDSTLDPDAPPTGWEAMGGRWVPVQWMSVPNQHGPTRGVFTGLVIRHDGWLRAFLDDYTGSEWRPVGTIRLAEVVVAGVGTNAPAYFHLVHLDDVNLVTEGVK